MDIFDPVNCERNFQNCATQHDINTYLYKLIKRQRELFCEFEKKQKDINDSQYETNKEVKNTLDEYKKLIDTANSNIDDLYKITDELKKEQDKVRADFVAFTQEVNRLLDLYRTNIDEISKTVDDLSIKVEKNRADIADLYTKLSEINRKIDELQIDEILAAFKENEERFKKVNQDIKDLSDKVDANNTDINTKLEQETKERKEEDTKLQSNIDTLNTKVDQNKLDSDNKFNDVIGRIGEVSDNLDKNVLRLDKRIDTEIAAREDADNNLNTKIETETSNRISMDNAINAKIDDLHLELARKDADLQNQINLTNQALEGETANRVAEDKKLQDQIDVVNKHLDDIDAEHKIIHDEYEKVNSQQEDILRRTKNSEDNIAGIQLDVVEIKDELRTEITERKANDESQNSRLDAIEARLDGIVLADVVQVCTAATVYTVEFKGFKFNYMLNSSGGLFTVSLESASTPIPYLFTGSQRYDTSNSTSYNMYKADGSLYSPANNIGFGNQDTNQAIFYVYSTKDNTAYRIEFYSQKSTRTTRTRIVTG